MATTGSVRTGRRDVQVSREERVRREQRQSEFEYRSGTGTGGRRTDVRGEAADTVAKPGQARHHGLQGEGEAEAADRVDSRRQGGEGILEDLHQHRSREGGHLLHQTEPERSRTRRFRPLQMHHQERAR